MRIEDAFTRALLREYGAEAEAQEEMRRIADQMIRTGGTPEEQTYARARAEAAGGLVAITVGLSAQLRWLKEQGADEQYAEKWAEFMELRRTAVADTSEMQAANRDAVTVATNDIMAEWIRERFAGIESPPEAE